jgi:hypothetical protein
MDEPVQMSLMDYEFNKKDERNQRLDSALDSIRKRYGSSAVVRGSMLKKK